MKRLHPDKDTVPCVAAYKLKDLLSTPPPRFHSLSPSLLSFGRFQRKAYNLCELFSLLTSAGI